MQSKKECVAAVNTLFAAKKAKNEALHQNKIAKAYAKIPSLKALDEEMKMNVSACVTFMMSGERNEEKMEFYRQKGKELKEKRDLLLLENGFSTDYTEPVYDCPLCKDTGERNGENCECYQKALSLEYLNRSKIVPEMKKLSFKDFKLDYYSKEKLASSGKSEYDTAKTILEYTKKYVSGFKTKKPNLLFYGTAGCGKTHLSCIIGMELIKRGNFVLYTSLQEMLDTFEAEKFGRGKADTEIYLDCDLLIIDDLGAEFQSAFSAPCIYHVINSRINSQKPFIVSTNYSLKEINENYDTRLSSRLAYDTINVHFPEVDIRLEKKRK